MRSALALLVLGGAVWAASCDFEYAYQQYCDGNPACGDAGTDAAVPDSDASFPDATAPDAATPDGSCDPNATAFSKGHGPSTCNYGQVCTAALTCVMPESHCLSAPELPSDLGPVIFDVVTKHSLAFCPHGEKPVRVEGRFYAPLGVEGELWGHFWPPPGAGSTQPDCLAQVYAEYPSEEAIIGDFVAEACCPNSKLDFKHWIFELSDELYYTSVWGTVVCLQ